MTNFKNIGTLFAAAATISLLALAACGGGDDASGSATTDGGASNGGTVGADGGAGSDDTGAGGTDAGSGGDDTGSGGDDTGAGGDDTGAGGDDSAGGTAGTAGTAGAPPDNTWDYEGAPAVVSTSPETASLGVLPDDVIQITFSQPMDPTTTEAAYDSTDLPKEDVTFSWNDAGTVLTITPNSKLTINEGVDPVDVKAKIYQLSIGKTAENQNGDTLGMALVLEFGTARRIKMSYSVFAPKTGSVRGDGSTFDTINVGDNSLNDQLVGTVVFSEAGIPSNIIQHEKAQLTMTQSTATNTPYELGVVEVIPHSFLTKSWSSVSSGLSKEDIGAAATTTLDEDITLDVTAYMNSRIGTNIVIPGVSFLLAFPSAFSDDGDSDIASFVSPELSSTFLIP